MEKIVYVTGNYGKYCSVKKYFEDNGLDIDYYNIDLEEPNINNIELISKEKAIKAYKILKKPCFVADSGFYIDDYPENPGYPGAFVKRSGISNNIDELLEKMKGRNRTCRFIDCLTFYDGNKFYQFYGISEGILSYQKKGIIKKDAKSNLWYVFIPINNTKTLAEMTHEEMNMLKKDHTSATLNFINWLKNDYLSTKKLDLRRPHNE